MNYLLRDRHGTYYFRRVIPAELRPFMPAPWTGKANWKESLQTKEPAAAKRAHARLLSRCVADFEEAERTKREGPAKSGLRRGAALPPVAEIEADFLSGLLEEDAAHRSSGDSRRQHQTAAERAQWDHLAPLNLAGRGMPPELHEAYGEELEMLAADFANAQARQDPSIVHAELKALLQRTGAVLDPSSDEYHEAGLAILRAHVRAYELKLERQRGKIVATPALSADRGPKLSEAFEAWKTGSGTRGSRKPSPKTLLEAVYAVRRFTEWQGDARLGDITRAMGREFALALAKVPTGLPDSLRQTPLRELVKREKDLAHLPPVHSGTINKSLNILSAIVSHAEAGGGLDAVPGFRNPFGKGVKLDTDRREADPRQPFSAADLKSIFGAGVFRNGERPTGGAGEAAFWLPLLALLSGARQGELAQLRVIDLAEDAESGVWYLDIGTAGGRSIKTASSQRRVPLHPALVDIGLLRYRASLAAAGAKPEASLWPALNIEREAQPAGAWSKWFTRFLRKTVGIADPTKVFHSFRHTFKRMARDAGLHEEMHDALTGHAGGGGVGRGYGRGFGLKAMAAEMAKIEVPEAVRSLRWSEAGAGGAKGASSKNR